MAGGAFHKKAMRRPILTRWEGDLMESIQQALYEAESFLPFICPMKAKHLVKAKYLEAGRRGCSIRLEALTGRTNKEQLTSVLKAVVAISRGSNGGALTNRSP